MLRDLTGKLAPDANQRATVNNITFDTEHKEDAVWLMVVNTMNTSFQIISNQDSGLRGYAPRYTQTLIYLNPRPREVQFVIDDQAGAVNNNAPGKLWAGIDKERLGDSYVLVF